MKVKSENIVRLYQNTMSLAAKENPGGLLTNPITRLGLKFDEGRALRRGSEYFQRALDPDAPGRHVSEPLAFDGEPLSANNCHKISPARS